MVSLFKIRIAPALLLCVAACGGSNEGIEAYTQERTLAQDYLCSCWKEASYSSQAQCESENFLPESTRLCLERVYERHQESVRTHFRCLTQAQAEFNACTRPLMCSEAAALQECQRSFEAARAKCPQASPQVAAEFENCSAPEQSRESSTESEGEGQESGEEDESDPDSEKAFVL